MHNAQLRQRDEHIRALQDTLIDARADLDRATSELSELRARGEALDSGSGSPSDPGFTLLIPISNV